MRGCHFGITCRMPSSPIFCLLLLLPYLPVTRTCCGAIAKSLNEPTCQVAVTFPVIQRPDGEEIRSNSLSTTTARRLPSLLTSTLDIGRSVVVPHLSRRQAQHDMS